MSIERQSPRPTLSKSSTEIRHSTHSGECPGPNWRSLSTPAILPVETDYLPDDFGTHAYEESNHSVLLPPGPADGLPEPVAQMVAQRVADLWECPVADVAAATTANAKRLFAL